MLALQHTTTDGPVNRNPSFFFLIRYGSQQLHLSQRAGVLSFHRGDRGAGRRGYEGWDGAAAGLHGGVKRKEKAERELAATNGHATNAQKQQERGRSFCFSSMKKSFRAFVACLSVAAKTPCFFSVLHSIGSKRKEQWPQTGRVPTPRRPRDRRPPFAVITSPASRS
jgi:hypothetical protein